MNILSIDTTTKNMLVGIKKNYLTYKNKDLNSAKHLEYLMPEIDSLLSQAELNIDNVDVIAVVVGPGSFTGIRIGIATAIGLSTRRRFKTIPVNSLDLIAYINYKKSQSRENVTCIIPSSLNKYYVADYCAMDRTTDITVKTLDEIKIDAIDKHIKIVVLGDDKCKEFEKVSYDADDLIDYTEELIKANKFAPLTPCYVSLSQAERELLIKEGKSGDASWNT